MILTDSELQRRIHRFLNRKAEQYPGLLDAEDTREKVRPIVRPRYT